MDTVTLHHKCTNSGAFLIPCFGCGTAIHWEGNIACSKACLENWKQKVNGHNGMGTKEPEMPPLDSPANQAEVLEMKMPEGSKANLELE